MKHDIDVFPDGSHRFAVESDTVFPRYALSRALRRGSVDGDGSACDLKYLLRFMESSSVMG